MKGNHSLEQTPYHPLGKRPAHGGRPLRRHGARRISAAPCGNCPVELTSAFLKLCLAQSCGKCVPCRIGLDRLADLLDRLLDGQGSQEDLETILRTAHTIVDSADCAIGFEAAQMVLDGYVAFYQDDYLAHVRPGQLYRQLQERPLRGAVPRPRRCPRLHLSWWGRGAMPTPFAWHPARTTPSPPCVPWCVSIPARATAAGPSWTPP